MKVEAGSIAIALEIQLQCGSPARMGLSFIPRVRLQSHRHYRMVLIVFADAVESVQNADAVAFELCSRPDARKHENLRRMIDAGAEHDFVGHGDMLAAVRAITNAFDFSSAQIDPDHLRAANDC